MSEPVMNKNFSLRKGFTLIEMLITITIFFVMITVVTTIFIHIYKTKGSLEARQIVTKESYFFLEKLQVMIKDYTIDYEEYRNRQQSWCMSPNNASWSGGSNCTVMTYYGNANAVEPVANQFQSYLYYCSSIFASFDSDYNIGSYNSNHAITDCLADVTGASSTLQSGFLQSYGQYGKLFVDVKDDVDYVPWPINDDDDDDLGKWPIAVVSDVANKIYPQELYLISKDKTRRLLFRRKLIEQSDYDGDGLIGDSETLYTIQVLQLRWFDAGINHDFNSVAYSGVYDGIIDTWACDYGLWFQCEWASVSGAYSDFKLPKDIDDGWQNLLTNDITISEWGLVISPLVNPYLSWAEDDKQISPSVSINFISKLYGKNWNLKIPRNQMDSYGLNLQTAFSL